MEIREFISRFREAFGDAASLPIAFGYSDTPTTEIYSVPKCIIGRISKVREGESLTLCADNVICGGGGLYTRFKQMPERVPVFVSEVEHYKRSKEMVIEYVESLEISISEKLSGICTWAFYDNNSPDAVTTQFASGCASIVTFAINENRTKGRRCFLGMLDPSARPLVPENELSLTIPMSRFKEMLATMNDSALFQKAFSILKKRINK